jgi:hypothetical protein
MRAMFLRSVLTLAVLCVSLDFVVAVQEPDTAPAPQPGVTMNPGQVQQLFDAMLVMQSQEALSLNEQQYAQFLTRLRVLQDTRRRNLQRRNRLITELQRLTSPRNVRPNATEADIKGRLQELQDLEAQSAAELRRAYDGIDEVLDVRQQARFRVFEEQIERRKLDLISRARQNNRPQPQRKQPPSD